MKTVNRKHIIVSLIVTIIIGIIGIGITYSNLALDENKVNSLAVNINEDVVFLSDIKFRNAKTAWGSILLDKTSVDTEFKLIIEGNKVTFKKGIWAHATSTIEIDLTKYKDYAYFVTYYGVNETSNNRGNGVKFYVYTSVDGTNWDLATDSNPKAYMSSSEAGYFKVDIRNANYLKLYAHDNGQNGNDHSIWADAKLVKEDYREEVVKTVSEYDEEIKSLYKGEITEDIELLILQRDLVNNVGQYTFKTFLTEEGKEQEHTETLNWLMNNLDVLKMYIMGGKPNGTYKRSLEVLSTLYHKYNDDLSNNLYRKMIISLSLSHSDNVAFWIHSAAGDPVDVNPNISDASNRYEILKRMYLDNKLDPLFSELEVEEMRYITYSFINDDEFEWLNAFAKSKNNRYSAYSYMGYKNVNTALYRSPKYYGEGRKDYEEKYKLTGFNVKNVAYYPRVWMIMEVGGVCWQLSNVGQNVISSLGLPSTVVGQPGHTAYIVYGKDNQGRSIWDIWNDVGGWTKTNTAGYAGTRAYYQIRLLNGWGNGSYASSNSGSYVLLAQKALDDYDNYVRAEELVKLANSYAGNLQKQEEIYLKALDIQDVNLDAWLGLINVYLNSNKTEEECFDLAKKLTNSLKYYPLPMHDLLRKLNTKISSTDVSVRFKLLESRTLSTAKVATDSQVAQYRVVNIMANYLLGIIDTNIAEFSFDGENANVLKLASAYETTHAAWEYSLDKGASWTSVTDGHSKKLSAAEVDRITAENDIQIHIIGTNRDPENIYTIDITKANLKSGLYANDLENRVLGVTNNEEWRYSSSDEWTSFETLPDLKGNKTVSVRTKATGTVLASEIQSFIFTQDDVNPKFQYVPITHLSVSDFSSETDRVGNREYARNAIDGNINTMWHTNRTIVETNKYIVLKLDVPMFISALEYVPYQNYGYGLMKDAVVSVSMDGTNWTEVASIKDRDRNYNRTMINFDKVEAAQYVKLYIESYDKTFANAALINLFHDSTKEEIPIANIELSTYEVTTSDVIATLIYDKDKLKITNNEGKDTYTFTENGTFTFEFENAKGIKGQATAVVSNIDRTAPTLDVTYDKTNKTNQPVTAVLKFSEPVIILNEDLKLEVHSEDNCYTYTFFENEEHIIKFRDAVGNVSSKVIKVNWIDNENPVGEITFSNVNPTTKKVIATLNANEKITVINNDGKNTYEFKENGEFIFKFRDEAGNVSEATAMVTWIEPAPIVNIVYSTTEKTSNAVIATLEVKGNIEIINNNGNKAYTFLNNGEFIFKFKDIDGDIHEISAIVDWIITDNQTNSNEPNKNETTNKPTNNKPSSKPNKKPSKNDELEEKYKSFEIDGIKLEIPSSVYNQKGTLVKKNLTLNSKYEKDFGALSECFQIYLQNEKGKMVNLPSSTYVLTFTIDQEKAFKGIYGVQNNKVIKLDYETKESNKITVKVNNIGVFVLSYEDKNITYQNQDKDNNLPIIPILAAVAILSATVLALPRIKRK